MGQVRRVGRPPAASREILEEAACELFLEQGYAATSVADITQRAGVSRATFFNYIPTKSDLLWTSVDDALDTLAAELERAIEPVEGEPGAGAAGERVADGEGEPGAGAAGEAVAGGEGEPGAGAAAPGATGASEHGQTETGGEPAGVRAGPGGTDQPAVAAARAALLRLAAALQPGTVVLAFANAEPMGMAEAREEAAARRQRRAASIIAAHLRGRGMESLVAEVTAAALAGAFLAALRQWSRSVPGRTSFPEVLGRALDVLS